MSRCRGRSPHRHLGRHGVPLATEGEGPGIGIQLAHGRVLVASSPLSSPCAFIGTRLCGSAARRSRLGRRRGRNPPPGLSPASAPRPGGGASSRSHNLFERTAPAGGVAWPWNWVSLGSDAWSPMGRVHAATGGLGNQLQRGCDNAHGRMRICRFWCVPAACAASFPGRSRRRRTGSK